MTEISLKNKTIISRLDAIKDEFFLTLNKNYPSKPSISSPEDKCLGEDFCSEYYLNELMDNWKDHVGFPEKFYSIPINFLHLENPNAWKFLKNYVKYTLVQEFGAHSSALFNYYPPGGYVGWHTNWNAHAYQVLLSWSETGNGYFKYFDKKLNEIVTLKDKPGWQARWFLFGKKENFHEHCWHCAYSDCNRLTFAFKFCDEERDVSKFLKNQFVEELEYES